MNSDTNSDAFWDRLKNAIGHQSNRSIADSCGLAEGTIRRYLKKEVYPSLDKIRAIADATGVNSTWLLTGDGPMRKGEMAPPPAPLCLPQSSQTSDTTQSAPYAAFDSLGVVEGMGMLTRIYSSGDTTYIRAINANLMAFSDAINMKKSNEDMQLEINDLKNRIVTLEQKINQLLETPTKITNAA